MLSPSLLPWQPLSGLLNGGHTTVSLTLDLMSSQTVWISRAHTAPVAARSLCGEIIPVPNSRLVQPMAPFQLVTELTASRVPSGVESRPRLRSVTSPLSGFISLPSWVGSSRIVTWAVTRQFSTSLWFVCLSGSH